MIILKKLSVITFIALSFFSFSLPALAADGDWNSIVSGCVTEDGVATLRCIPAVIQNVVTFALIASGVVAVIFIIWAGARYVTSGGDQKRVDAARKTLTWAIIGLIIILMSFFIINFIGYLTGTEDCINKVGFENEGCQ